MRSIFGSALNPIGVNTYKKSRLEGRLRNTPKLEGVSGRIWIGLKRGVSTSFTFRRDWNQSTERIMHWARIALPVQWESAELEKRGGLSWISQRRCVFAASSRGWRFCSARRSVSACKAMRGRLRYYGNGDASSRSQWCHERCPGNS